MKHSILGGALSVCLVCAGVAAAQSPVSAVPSKPLPAGAGKPAEISMRRAASTTRDLRTLPQTRPVKLERPEREEPEIDRIELPGRPPSPSAPVPPARNAPAPPPIQNFDGLDFATWGGGHPPDTNGDVGPTYYIQTVNTSIGIYAKSDGARVAAFTFNTFMSQGALRQPVRHRTTSAIRSCSTTRSRTAGSSPTSRSSSTARATSSIRPAPSSASPSPRPATRSPAAGTSTRSTPPAAWATIRSSASGRTASTCRPTCSAIRPAARSMNPRVYAFNKAQMYAGEPTVQVVSFDAAVGGVHAAARATPGCRRARRRRDRPNYFVVRVAVH